MSEKELEKIVKGFGNYWRILILKELKRNSGQSVDDIATQLKANYKTISVHIRQMNSVGLVSKKYVGQGMQHKLTKRGEVALHSLLQLTRA